MGIDFLIGGVLALIMFAIGLSLDKAHFKAIARQPKVIILGLLLQMAFLPATGFAVALATDLPAAWKAGIIIIAISPGGATSNFISHVVNADVALSIALTSLNSILILVTIPLFTQLIMQLFMAASGEGYQISLADASLQVLLVVLFPAFLGALVNDRFGGLSKQGERWLKVINTLLLAIVFGTKFFASESQGGSGLTIEELRLLLWPCLFLHLFGMIMGYGTARIFKLPSSQSVTLGIEVGLQNTTLALLVAGTLLNINEMTKPALVYATFSFFTTLAFAAIVTYALPD